ncbi:type III ribulose-bisphosphate carboxylase [Candidatus Woesearchaeota archaeon]|nr:type III ribulose-bisphosphate carboxylase [Candidatus Woesearchaeota archaeon]
MKNVYKQYIKKRYKPKRNEIVCEFYFEPRKKAREAAGAIAAESSTGTWTTLSTMQLKRMAKFGAKVFELKKNKVKIAYPLDLFELGNMPQIYSSIAGNIFGMKEIKNLRLVDVYFPAKLTKSFKGPQFGLQGVRKILGVKKRPLCGTIVKPKLGLTSKEHAKVAYESWIGGLDIVKDDENLTSQPFNKFKQRARQTIKLKKKAEKETGEKKIYMCNVTAETNEMLKRAKFLKSLGNEYAMVDILTAGWSGLQSLRNELQKLKLVIHGHRAMHAAFTRNPKHGIKMSVIAKTARLIGVDQLHIGTAVGKMAEDKKAVLENIAALKNKMSGIKRTFPVCSGGLQPAHVPKLVKYFGHDIIIQAGGGVHGHPKGTKAGARAMRQAIDAVMKKISLKKYIKKHNELRLAIKKWGYK